ncbi:DNA ligase (NAD+) [Fistulifera solaris]|uniref:DNA ligase (NAD(+)) n=1 Tax=Fistulifera solaris TaxID=1519565 RepID=A0A1Z5JTD6_FISSO|nr:DNA ligase (NAD+) [Fistulifera solaris]|eukprot:GAX17277.1 DNA ligase (NAD+) [Fistulifera solaris]
MHAWCSALCSLAFIMLSATKKRFMACAFQLARHCHRIPTHPRRFRSTTNENDLDAIYQELLWLSNEIRKQDERYYNNQQIVNASEAFTISDDEYDALVRREEALSQEYPHLLKKLQKEVGLGTATTRAGRVGTTPLTTSRIKQKHRQSMLSLENVHDTTQLLAWLERIRKKLVNNKDKVDTITITTEPKIDGLSLNLRYTRQSSPSDTKWSYQLQWAATRGDGKQGMDVTHSVRSCSAIPPNIILNAALLKLPLSCDAIEIKGEVVLPQSVFDNEGVHANFSNARNAASGILLRKEVSGEQEEESWADKLSFYAYDLDLGRERALDGQEAQKVLLSLGFHIPQPTISTTMPFLDDQTQWNETDITNLLSYHKSLMKHREDPKKTSSTWHWGDYEMDGCVHKVDGALFRAVIGNSNRAPRWAVAHKFPPRVGVTKLLDVIVQVGRTGSLTPVAILEPIDLNGVSVQRATLHNFRHLQQTLGGKSIPRETSVMVRRAGEVIPQVVGIVGEVNKHAQANISLEAPTSCPACGSIVVAERESTGNDDRGFVLRCGGPALLCPPRAVMALSHAFSRDALDVTGLSQNRIEQLMEAGLLKVPSDLFVRSDNFTETVAALNSWGPKSAQNLVATASKIANAGVDLSRFIYSLNIRFVGIHSSTLLAGLYGSVESFLSDIEKVSKSDEDECFTILREDNEATKGIGPAVINALLCFGREEELVRAARALSRAINVHDASSTLTPLPTPGNLTTDLPFAGWSVVFTGSMPDMSRTKAQEMAKSLGAKSTPGSVSKSTNLVVAGDKGGKKFEQAQNLGVKVMSADDFIRLWQNYNSSGALLDAEAD